MKSFRKKTKNLFKFDTSVKSVEVDTEYNLTIYLEGGEIKTINLKEFIYFSLIFFLSQ